MKVELKLKHYSTVMPKNLSLYLMRYNFSVLKHFVSFSKSSYVLVRYRAEPIIWGNFCGILNISGEMTGENVSIACYTHSFSLVTFLAHT